VLCLNAVIVVLGLFILRRKGAIDTDNAVTIDCLTVLAFAVIHAIYLVLAISLCG
jgi:uncharacterized membrane protein YqaE (UPF0057 family)